MADQRSPERELEVTLTVKVKTFGKLGRHERELAYRIAGVLVHGLHKDDVVVLLHTEEGSEEVIIFDAVIDDGHPPPGYKPKPGYTDPCLIREEGI